jgi:hypothetical protein
MRETRPGIKIAAVVGVPLDIWEHKDCHRRGYCALLLFLIFDFLTFAVWADGEEASHHNRPHHQSYIDGDLAAMGAERLTKTSWPPSSPIHIADASLPGNGMRKGR